MDTIKIPVGKNLFALIDECDFEQMSQFVWFLHKGKYARCGIYRNGSRRMLLMHRLILDISPDERVDHANGNGLDNRRVNIRIATQSQNNANMARNIKNVSGYKGVSWNAADKKWRAAITVNRKNRTIVRSSSPIEAALAYDAAARVHFGEFARLNFPMEGERAT